MQLPRQIWSCCDCFEVEMYLYCGGTANTSEPFQRMPLKKDGNQWTITSIVPGFTNTVAKRFENKMQIIPYLQRTETPYVIEDILTEMRRRRFMQEPTFYT